MGPQEGTPATSTRSCPHLVLPAMALLQNLETGRAPIPDVPDDSGTQESGKGGFRQDNGR